MLSKKQINYWIKFFSSKLNSKKYNNEINISLCIIRDEFIALKYEDIK